MNNCIRNQQKNINYEENVLDLPYRICKEPHEHIKVFFQTNIFSLSTQHLSGFLKRKLGP